MCLRHPCLAPRREPALARYGRTVRLTLREDPRAFHSALSGRAKCGRETVADCLRTRERSNLQTRRNSRARRMRSGRTCKARPRPSAFDGTFASAERADDLLPSLAGYLHGGFGRMT